MKTFKCDCGQVITVNPTDFFFTCPSCGETKPVPPDSFVAAEKEENPEKDLIYRQRYEKAVSLMEAGNYEEAIVQFEDLGDFEDSATYLADCQRMLDKSRNKTTAAPSAFPAYSFEKDEPVPPAGSRPFPSFSFEKDESVSSSAASWTCPVCGAEMTDGERFCTGCGRDRNAPAPASSVSDSWTCPVCGAEMTDGERFCTGCGGDRNTPAPAASVSDSWTCPVCGAEMTDGERFCTGCGCDRNASAPAADPWSRPVFEVKETEPEYTAPSYSIPEKKPAPAAPAKSKAEDYVKPLNFTNKWRKS